MAWTLVNSWTYSINVAQVDFTGLAGYSDVRILVRGVTMSGSGVRALRVSIDNGSTFLAGTEYVSVASDGTEATGSSIGIHVTGTTAARSGEIEIYGFNLTSPKVAQKLSRTDSHTIVIPTASALNAVRIFDNVGGTNLTGGSIYVYAR